MSFFSRTAAFVFMIAVASAPSAAAQDRASPSQPAVSAGENGFTLQSANGDFQLRLGVLVHVDGRFAPGDDAERVIDTFAVRRLRTPFRGRLARRFEFYVNPDFAGGSVVVQDAYLDTVFSPAVRVRFGKTKTPLGLERLQSVSAMLFFDRALTSALVPNRDVGVQVMGDLAGGVVTYQGGVLNGVADGGSGDTDSADSKDLAGRVFVRPFQKRPATDPLRGLGVGIGGTTGTQSGTAPLPTLRTSLLQQVIFSYTGASAAGRRTRYSPQASYVYKSFAAFGEYVRTAMPLASATASADVTHSAWQVAGSIVLTGEAATDSSTAVRPRANVNLENGSWGAVQLAARYHRLEVDGAARRFASPGSALEAAAWTVGVNWFLTPNIRYTLNFERTVFDRNDDRARPAENAVVFRSQLGF